MTLFSPRAGAGGSPYAKAVLADELASRGDLGEAARLLDEAIRQNTSDLITRDILGRFALRIHEDWEIKRRMGADLKRGFDHAGTLEYFGDLLGKMGLADLSGKFLGAASLVRSDDILTR
ncbi:hypothetical protein FDZ71_10085 [bacterium]|nr:MAG: hypothetical protein FDZ71_10085 [bacterium]